MFVLISYINIYADNVNITSDYMERALGPVPADFVTYIPIVEAKTPAVEVLAKIKDKGAVIVTKNREYFGMVDDVALSQKGTMKFPPSLKVEKLVRKLPSLNSQVSIENAVLYVYQHSARVLPFIEENKIKGGIKRETMLSSILSLHLLSGTKVQEAMSSPVVAIDKNASVAQAKSVMSEYKIDRLVVLNGGKTYGVISYDSIIQNFAKTNLRTAPKINRNENKLNTVTVGDACDKDIPTIDYGESVENAIRQILENKTNFLVVTKGDRPVGVLAMRDLFEMVVASVPAEEGNIMVSGVDENIAEYRDEISSELSKFSEKVGRFNHLKIDKIYVHVKHGKNYEIRARVVIEKRNNILATASAHLLDEALSDVIKKLYDNIKNSKEIILTYRKEEKNENA